MAKTTDSGAFLPQLLDVSEVAHVLGVPISTVYSWRTHGKGPRGIRVGRHLRFRAKDLEDWIDSQLDPRGPSRGGAV